MLSHRHLLALAAVCLAIGVGARAAAAQEEARQQGMPTASVKAIAAQLGAKVQPREDDELGLGTSFTAMLEQPDKLAEFGIKGMHPGARVTVARVGPDRIRVEVDEMDPVPARGSATLRLDAKGMAVAPKG
jgi:hypothetical protein